MFTDVTAQLDAEARKPIVGRGVAVGDLTNSGHLDVVISNLEGKPLLLKNLADRTNHWLTLRLIGTKSNRDGFGARIIVVAGGQTQRFDATNTGSFLSASDPRPHFGLGKAQQVQSLKIHWSSGREQTFTDLSADRCYRVTEGEAPIEDWSANRSSNR